MGDPIDSSDDEPAIADGLIPLGNRTAFTKHKVRTRTRTDPIIVVEDIVDRNADRNKG